jgi:hypothetical protein
MAPTVDFAKVERDSRRQVEGQHFLTRFNWRVPNAAPKGGFGKLAQAARNKLHLDDIDADHLAMAFDEENEVVMVAHMGDRDPWKNGAMAIVSPDATAGPGQMAFEEIAYKLDLLEDEQIKTILTGVVSTGFGKLAEKRYEMFSADGSGKPGPRLAMDRYDITTACTAQLLGKFQRDMSTGLWTHALIKDSFNIKTGDPYTLASTAKPVAARS